MEVALEAADLAVEDGDQLPHHLDAMAVGGRQLKNITADACDLPARHLDIHVSDVATIPIRAAVAMNDGDRLRWVGPPVDTPTIPTLELR